MPLLLLIRVHFCFSNEVSAPIGRDFAQTYAEWPVDAKNFAKRIQNGLKAAAEEHVSSKSRPIGAEILFGE